MSSSNLYDSFTSMVYIKDLNFLFFQTYMKTNLSDNLVIVYVIFYLKKMNTDRISGSLKVNKSVQTGERMITL